MDDHLDARVPEPGPIGLSEDELAAEGAEQLPDKQAMSVLDISANIDVGLDVVGAIDAAVAANAQAAAPAEAAASLNVLSTDATSVAVADQSSSIAQSLDADAVANATQDADIAQ